MTDMTDMTRMTANDILAALEQEGNLRTLQPMELHGTEIVCDGRSYLNLSSNDYLGLSASDMHREFMASAALWAAEGEFLLSNPSSRLVTGNSNDYAALEEAISSLYGGRAALVLGSGFLLNAGVLPAITTKDDVILADKFVHASIIDGLRLCEAEWHRYAHNDMEHLERLIVKHRAGCRGDIYIVTESVFSMDGDLAPIEELVALKEKYGCRIYLDEAHAFGVCGPGGRGVAAGAGGAAGARVGSGLGGGLDGREAGDEGAAGVWSGGGDAAGAGNVGRFGGGGAAGARVGGGLGGGLDAKCDYIVATLGKAIASQGAFIVCDELSRELMVNRMRTLIYSTALPPISLRWSKYVIERLSEMEPRREHLRQLAGVLGGVVGAERGGAARLSHIIPIMAGENQRAIEMSRRMREAGYWVTPIRYPTVPKGAARIRISLTAAMTTEEIEKFAALCRELR